MLKYDCIQALQRAGIAHADAVALRRLAMRLHRWHELECGIDNGGIERDETSLARVMARYPALAYYVQGDPRGAALYVLRAGDIPPGESAGVYYSRGIAVYR